MSADTVAPAFELDRFDVLDGRVEVRGRWFGVRGRRFVRPTLEIDGVRPLLAVLDHKPWATGDGEDWVAAFPWDDAAGPPEGATLAVAPDIAVVVGSGDAAEPRRFHRASEAAGRATRARPVVDDPGLRRERDDARRERDAAVETRDAALRARDEAIGARDEALRTRENVARELRA